jgi:hypothetical protein
MGALESRMTVKDRQAKMWFSRCQSAAGMLKQQGWLCTSKLNEQGRLHDIFRHVTECLCTVT